MSEPWVFPPIAAKERAIVTLVEAVVGLFNVATLLIKRPKLGIELREDLNLEDEETNEKMRLQPVENFVTVEVEVNHIVE